MGRHLAIILCIGMWFGGSQRALAQSCGDPPDMLIVIDRSGSMSLDNKWNDAKSAINNLLTAYTGTVRFGLLLFPTTNGICQVTTVQVAPNTNTQAAIMNELNKAKPQGKTTPLGLALGGADSYLTSIDPGITKYVLLITDGEDTCVSPSLPTATQRVQTLLNDGIRTYVVGFGTGVNATELSNMAQAGGTALSGTPKYYQASNQSQLSTALQTIAGTISCCGNGALDPGELCDTGIASGSGKCPTAADCNDGKACTADTVTGSGCNAACSNTPITTAKDNDGCCPAGATTQTDNDCQAQCGNGAVETGELCDTGISSGAGKCPTLADCDDGKPCTADTLSGSGCNAQCKHTPLTATLAQKDGCCPAGSSSLADADCPVVCGNGLLESGERCDTAITAGAGRCPTTAACNDVDPCTADTVIGSGCDARCSNTPMTANTNGPDGCCPAGANSQTDSDCDPSCGNGLRESGESCDPGITAGAGKCPTVADCNDNNPCTNDSLSGQACSLACRNIPVAADPTQSDGCCPPGATRVTDIDCQASCGNGALEPGEVCDTAITAGNIGACKTAADCDDGDVCTADTLVGSGCSVNCTNGALDADATAKDGCCPAGANALTDADCASICGNGILEPDERCDTAIAAGILGSCPQQADCDDSDRCTADTLMGSDCTTTCRSTELAPDVDTKDGCCPSGNSSLTDADCLPPCGPDRTTDCVDLCAGVSCPSDQYCKLGKCETFPDGGIDIPDAGVSLGDLGEGFVAQPAGCDCRVPSGDEPVPTLVFVLLGVALVALGRRRFSR